MTWWTKQENPCQLSWSFPCLCGPLGVLVYTSAKGVEFYFFLQVNFKAWSVFRKCFKTLGEMKMLSALWLSIPVIRCCFFRWWGALCGGWGIQVSVALACCLEYKCEWSTDCLLPNWKCFVGIYWHGIIPRRRRKKKKKERETWLHIFFFKSVLWLLFNFYFFLVIKSWLFYLNLSFFIYWSERHFKGIIIIYWCNLIGATCFMAPVKIGFHSFDWFEPRTAYRGEKAG